MVIIDLDLFTMFVNGMLAERVAWLKNTDNKTSIVSITHLSNIIHKLTHPIGGNANWQGFPILLSVVKSSSTSSYSVFLKLDRGLIPQISKRAMTVHKNFCLLPNSVSK